MINVEHIVEVMREAAKLLKASSHFQVASDLESEANQMLAELRSPSIRAQQKGMMAAMEHYNPPPCGEDAYSVRMREKLLNKEVTT